MKGYLRGQAVYHSELPEKTHLEPVRQGLREQWNNDTLQAVSDRVGQSLTNMFAYMRGSKNPSPTVLTTLHQALFE